MNADNRYIELPIMKKLLLAAIVAFSWTLGARAQMLAANVDGLWLATLTPNIGAELVIGGRSTLGLHGLFATKPLGKDVKIYAIQPEYRYFFSGRPMFREFIGVGAIGASYDITWAGKVYDGTAVGLGLTFGYVLPIKKRINIDFHAGFGIIRYKHKEYFVGDQYDVDYIFDGEQRANASGYYLLPTRIGVSVSYILW